MYIDRFNNSKSTTPFLIDLQLFAEGEGVENSGNIEASGNIDNPIDTSIDSSNDTSPQPLDTFTAAMKFFTNPEEGQVVEGTEHVEQIPQSSQDPTKDNPAIVKDMNTESPSNKDNLHMYQQLGFKTENDMAIAYQNLRSDYTKKAQELAQFRNGLNNQQTSASSESELEQRIIEKLQNQGQVQAQESQQEQQKELSVEEIEAQKEEFEEAFYKDIPGTIEKLVSDRLEKLLSEKLKPVEERINPVIEEIQYEKQVNTMQELVSGFAQQNPDMMEHIDDMKTFFQENVDLPTNENSLRVAYNYAKGLKSSINPQQLLSDPNYVLNNITNNPEMLKELIKSPAVLNAILGDDSAKNNIVSSHMKNIKASNASIPIVMGGGNSGATTPTPRREAKTWDDATSQAIAILSQTT